MTLSCPERYKVIFESITNEKHSYTVCTWQSKDKAIALCVLEHCRLKRPEIYQVAIELLGPSPKDNSGTVKLVEGDILDRMEW